MRYHHEDYVFRFNLKDISNGDAIDPLVEMIRLFLKDFQEIGYLCYKGQKVYIDSFVLNNQDDTHKL